MPDAGHFTLPFVFDLHVRPMMTQEECRDMPTSPVLANLTVVTSIRRNDEPKPFPQLQAAAPPSSVAAPPSSVGADPQGGVFTDQCTGPAPKGRAANPPFSVEKTCKRSLIGRD